MGSKPQERGKQAGFNRVLLRDIAVIYLLTFVVGVPFYFWKLHSDLSGLGQSALSRIDLFVEQTTHSLAPLVSLPKTCTSSEIDQLRQTVFHSYRVKEIGLINPAGRVFCTSNLGNTSIPIYNQTLSRWRNAPDGRTLALVRAKTGKTHSLFVYLQGPHDMGANALIPPDVLNELVGKGFPFPDLPFAVKVAGNALAGSVNAPLEVGAMHETDRFSFYSAQNPVELQFQVTPAFQRSYMLEHSWIPLLLGTLFSAVYTYASRRRVARQSLPATFEWALKNNELEVFFQPIMDTDLGGPLGFELLLRWHHPAHGIISPMIFIPLAEQLGKIGALTDFVMETAIGFIQENPELMKSRYLAINISRQLLLDEHFAERVCRRCGRNQHLIRHLLLEVTEDLAFSDAEMDQAITQLHLLQQHGFRIAVDDFGTGYSGLDLLRRFPFDVVKIDKVFIKELLPEGNAVALLDSMIGLADGLGMVIIAEGVETAQQADSLLQRGVNHHQGFYYAKPMPQSALVAWLARSGASEPAEGAVTVEV
ncbi:EAL domain-containing protein [Photobacterium atrarenae]|uniref:cyclic-guanylate-specific phosphodiesterase n=1 Tax=Photobacterium atrarenae TaxID=865757 RepID=A0ABY5GHQ8_9GAMM|nr:EAL domain-containing protein [Photobacterium atrarenae]UTV28664.1 EAL domain-containing protein [Photobacterium atrarenae]